MTREEFWQRVCIAECGRVSRRQSGETEYDVADRMLKKFDERFGQGQDVGKHHMFTVVMIGDGLSVRYNGKETALKGVTSIDVLGSQLEFLIKRLARGKPYKVKLDVGWKRNEVAKHLAERGIEVEP